MVEISTDSMKRTGVRHEGGRVFQMSASISGLRENSPPPAGTSLSLISASQAGWTQSPVPTTAMPLRAAHHARCSRSRSRLVAREYLECTCRSAWNCMAYVRRVHERCRDRPSRAVAYLSTMKRDVARTKARLSTCRAGWSSQESCECGQNIKALHRGTAAL